MLLITVRKVLPFNIVDISRDDKMIWKFVPCNWRLNHLHFLLIL